MPEVLIVDDEPDYITQLNDYLRANKFYGSWSLSFWKFSMAISIRSVARAVRPSIPQLNGFSPNRCCNTPAISKASSHIGEHDPIQSARMGRLAELAVIVLSAGIFQ